MGLQRKKRYLFNSYLRRLDMRYRHKTPTNPRYIKEEITSGPSPGSDQPCRITFALPWRLAGGDKAGSCPAYRMLNSSW